MQNEKDLAGFVKRHPKLVCIDSDGTALDTMTVKHEKCFGPCFVEEWRLSAVREQALNRWKEINLYERTRGKNRFITLGLILQEYDGKYLHANGLKAFTDWVDTTTEISAKSLARAQEEVPSETMEKALRWSDAVNRKIAQLTFEDKRPFPGVREFLDLARGKADLAVVSSADAASMNAEWRHHGLTEYVDVITSQEVGTKAECIAALLRRGYAPEDVLMVGDSMPDIDAAEQCGVMFFPILAGKERESWRQLKDIYFREFDSGNYRQSCEMWKRVFNEQLI